MMETPETCCYSLSTQ